MQVRSGRQIGAESIRSYNNLLYFTLMVQCDAKETEITALATDFKRPEWINIMNHFVLKVFAFAYQNGIVSVMEKLCQLFRVRDMIQSSEAKLSAARSYLKSYERPRIEGLNYDTLFINPAISSRDINKAYEEFALNLLLQVVNNSFL